MPEVLTVNETLIPELKAWSIPADVRTQAQVAATAPAPPASAPRQPQPGRTYKVALLYFGPHPIFEMAMEGIVSSLQDAGFAEGRNLVLQRVHPNNDMSLLPQVVRQLANQNPDLFLALSTPCLGATIANTRDVPIVFGVVSAPLQAGAGRTFDDHLPRVTGAVWTCPDPALFKWLKEIVPACRKVGLIYNPAEANSVKEKDQTRPLLAVQGMTLEECGVTSSSEIPQAFQALLAKQVDAIFGMADNTVISAYAALGQSCRREHLPLLADDNSQMGTGALFTCGVSPQGEGRQAGRLAARVLLGENPAAIPFQPSSETQIAVDFSAAANLKIALPVALLKATDIFYHAAARVGRPYRIAMVNLVQNPLLEAAEQGVLRGLREAGFQAQDDFTVKHFNAQGEIAQLPAILDAAMSDNPDLIVTVTTPALIAATKRVTKIPIVFTVSSDPAVVGLFTPENRPGLIAGVHDNPPVARLLDMARKHDPALSVVGIVYDPSQPNSRISVEKLRTACRERSMTLREATAGTVSELPAASQAVIQRGAGAILLSADNLATTGFAAIVGAAKSARIPIYVTDTELVHQGASGAVGDNYEAWGAQSGRLAAKVLAGVPPGDLPLESTRVQEVIDPGNAKPAALPPPQIPQTPPASRSGPVVEDPHRPLQ